MRAHVYIQPHLMYKWKCKTENLINIISPTTGKLVLINLTVFTLKQF